MRWGTAVAPVLGPKLFHIEEIEYLLLRAEVERVGVWEISFFKKTKSFLMPGGLYKNSFDITP